MKRIIYLALICFYVTVALPAYCQLSGKVQDNTYQPLPFANVLLLTSLIKGVITNDEGQFTIPPVPVGNYLLAVSMVGYQPHDTSVDIYSRKALDLGTLVLQPSAQELESVVIRGQKPLWDFLIFHLTYLMGANPFIKLLKGSSPSKNYLPNSLRPDKKTALQLKVAARMVFIFLYSQNFHP